MSIFLIKVWNVKIWGEKVKILVILFDYKVNLDNI